VWCSRATGGCFGVAGGGGGKRGGRPPAIWGGGPPGPRVQGGPPPPCRGVEEGGKLTDVLFSCFWSVVVENPARGLGGFVVPGARGISGGVSTRGPPGGPRCGSPSGRDGFWWPRGEGEGRRQLGGGRTGGGGLDLWGWLGSAFPASGGGKGVPGGCLRPRQAGVGVFFCRAATLLWFSRGGGFSGHGAFCIFSKGAGTRGLVGGEGTPKSETRRLGFEVQLRPN